MGGGSYGIGQGGISTRIKVVGILLIASFVGASVTLAAQPKDYATIAYRNADKHMDEIVWVEGVVLKTESDRNGTFLCFSNNKKYVRVLVPEQYIENFEGGIKYRYVGKRIKAIGKVARNPTAGLIVGVSEPKRIKVVDNPTS